MPKLENVIDEMKWEELNKIIVEEIKNVEKSEGPNLLVDLIEKFSDELPNIPLVFRRINIEHAYQESTVIGTKRKEQAEQIIRLFIKKIFPEKNREQQIKISQLLLTHKEKKQLTLNEIQWFLNKVKDAKKYSVSKEKNKYAELSEKTEDLLESMRQKENVKINRKMQESPTL
ncbi:hypothetical protein ACTNBL_09270 [Enterococcus villorum]|uniref:Uncharacterized protein n=2 Tax=Enterococcus villorum TaxID=112904 RepID=A0A511J1C4_9ENTE|nr:hypothetical protein [Enterococcus villorum]EOH87658.1 hypothetical protein UAO_02370 [Enterococcus villorum ATCC 700913]EOW77623.1 hypothetical protein I591_00476 [Enterococcus villorum ATCC 700913]GEL91469.1 hypothetical protein EVI01_08060 [Enterococcus villorum]